MNALVPVPVRAAPVSRVSRAAIAQRIVSTFESAAAKLFTAHDSRVENVALIVDEALPPPRRPAADHRRAVRDARGSRLRLPWCESCARAHARRQPSWPRLRSPNRRRAIIRRA
jgi:hypothetical protein